MLAAPGIGVVGCRARRSTASTSRRRSAPPSPGPAAASSAASRAASMRLRTLAALESGGTTIAVLGCGVDVYYPQQNMALQDRIGHAGLLLSEFLPGDHPRKYRSPTATGSSPR
jgi:DNA processing protein